MKDLNVSEFKTHLAAYLREVKGGETLVITEHKKAVAEVRRIGGVDSIVVPAQRPFTLANTRPSNAKKGIAFQLLDEDRTDRWADR